MSSTAKPFIQVAVSFNGVPVNTHVHANGTHQPPTAGGNGSARERTFFGGTHNHEEGESCSY